MKVTIGRIFETSRALSTKAGQELTDVLNFVAQFAELTLRSLRNGLTDADNTDCTIRIVQLTNEPISIPTTKRPVEIRARRVLSATAQLARPIAWYFGSNGSIVVQANFVTAPTQPIDVEIIILY